MSKMIISNNDLVSAVKKASVSLKDTFVLSVIAKDVGAGKRQGSLACCNGNTQANIYIAVKADDDACGEYIFGKEFGAIVQTLSGYDEADFRITCQKDGTCKISCGSAVVPVPVRDSATKITVQPPDQSGSSVIEIAAEEFKKSVSRGGASFSTVIGGSYEMIRNAINLVPEKNGEQYYLRIVSTDGVMASSARTRISKQNGLDQAVKEGLSLSVNATVLCKVASLISSKEVILYISKEQLLVRDGFDIYVIVPNAAAFPAGISQLLLIKPEERYRFKVSKKRMLSAVEVALLNSGSNAADKKVCAMLEDDKLMISSTDGVCRSRLEASELSGSTRMGLNAPLLKILLSHMGEDVLFYGAGATNPIYISDGTEGCMSFLAPATYEDVSESDDGANEE